MDNKELRKMLNKAWDDGRWYGYIAGGHAKGNKNRRYREVSKIIKEAEAATWRASNENMRP